MGKTLVIPGADFSSVAIDTVEIPHDTLEKTHEWMEASGNVFTAAQQAAIDNLVRALYSGAENAIINKIDHMYLPMLAASKQYALVDYASEELISPDMSGDTTYESYVDFSNHGLKSNITTGNYNAPVVDANYQMDTQDISMFILNTLEYDTIPSSSKNKAGMGCKTGSKTFYVIDYANRIQCMYNGSGAGYDSTEGFRRCSLKGVISTSNELIGIYDKGNESATAVTSETLTGLSILTGSNYYLIKDDSKPLGAFIVGKAITEEQAATLKQYVDALFAAIIA